MGISQQRQNICKIYNTIALLLVAFAAIGFSDSGDKADEAIITLAEEIRYGGGKIGYTMEWTAKSNTEILTFKIEYKVQGDHQWKEFEAPAQPVSGGEWTGTAEGRYFFRNLRSATTYTVRIKSKNANGYNDFGEEFLFMTKRADP